MRNQWVLLLEVACLYGREFERAIVEPLLEGLADRSPSALYAADRCALQFVVEATGPDDALTTGLAVWRGAAAAAGFPCGEVVRAEVKTPAELLAEHEDADASRPESSGFSERALLAGYQATRDVLAVHTPREAVSVLMALVRALGGTILSPRPGDPRTLDLDLSLGVCAPMVAAAEPCSVPRLYLEEVLPRVVADATRVVELLRAASASGGMAFADLDHP